MFPVDLTAETSVKSQLGLGYPIASLEIELGTMPLLQKGGWTQLLPLSGFAPKRQGPNSYPPLSRFVLRQRIRELAPIEGAVDLTRVDFPVSAHTIGIHNALEAGGKAVGPDEGWRHVLAGDAVSDSTHSFLTLGYPGRETEADARAY